MKAVKRILTVVCALLLFVGGAELWRYALIDDSASYTRIMMHQLYTSEQNIDVLFLGSSHAYRSFIPSVMDEITGLHSFNCGTSSQSMDGSAALLREAGRNNDLRTVYLELYYNELNEPDYKARDSMTATYIISDYMRLGLNRVRYLLRASGNEHWINSFLIARRNWSSALKPGYIKKTVAKKQTAAYRNYEYVRKEGAEEYYVDRGFVANDAAVEPGTVWNKKAYGRIGVGDEIRAEGDWYDSLREIAGYCRKRDIALVFVVAPQPDWTLIGKGNYPEFHAFLADLAAEMEVELYDFNLCRSEYFDTGDLSLFKDEDHLNTAGAERLTRLFARCVSGQERPEDVLYDSYEEKLAGLNLPFYGLAGPSETDDGAAAACSVISGRESCEFAITFTDDAGVTRFHRPFSPERSFSLPAGVTGTVTVAWREQGGGVPSGEIRAAYPPK